MVVSQNGHWTGKREREVGLAGSGKYASRACRAIDCLSSALEDAAGANEAKESVTRRVKCRLPQSISSLLLAVAVGVDLKFAAALPRLQPCLSAVASSSYS